MTVGDSVVVTVFEGSTVGGTGISFLVGLMDGAAVGNLAVTVFEGSTVGGGTGFSFLVVGLMDGYSNDG